MDYVKYQVVELDYDGSGKNWYLFDDMDNPVNDANDFLQSRNYKSNTQSRIAYSLCYFYEFLDNEKGMKHPSHLSYADWLDYLKWLKGDSASRGGSEHYRRGGLKQRTFERYRDDARLFLMTHIKRVHGLALEIEPERTTAVDDPKSKAVSIEDWQKLMSVANSRNRLIYQFLYESGIRAGELFNIDVEEFNNVPRAGLQEFFFFSIHVAFNEDPRKQPKTQGRVVPIRTALAEKVSRYVRTRRMENKNKHSEIFTLEGYGKKADGTKTCPGDPLTYDALYSAMKSDAVRAGLDPDKIAPHKSRHSYATNLLVDGAREKEVSDYLGHKSLQTIQVYSKGLALKIGKGAVDSVRAVGQLLDGIGAAGEEVVSQNDMYL